MPPRFSCVLLSGLLYKAHTSHSLACISLFCGMEEQIRLLWELMAPAVQAESFTHMDGRF